MIKIYSIHFNRPDFVHLQSRTLKQFLRDEFELIIVNNANEHHLFEGISNACKSESLREFVVPFNINRQAAQAYPGYHHSIAMNGVLAEEISKHDDICVILDGDVFLLGEFSFSKNLENFQMLGALQHRKGRYWLTPVVLALKPKDLEDFGDINLIGSHIYNATPNDTQRDSSHYPRLVDGSFVFDCPVCSGFVENNPEHHIPLDTGGNLYMYLKSHPNVKVRKLSSTSHLRGESLNCLPEKFRSRYNEDFTFEFYGEKFLHYCRSSNWDHKTDAYHSTKTKLLVDMIESAISGNELFSAEFQFPDSDWSGWPETAVVNHGIRVSH